MVIGHLGLQYGHEWIPWFWGTMEVFFALSGFLITRILLGRVAEPHVLKKYFVRRALRIWPLYFLVLFFCCALDELLSRAQGQPSPLGWGVVKSIFFVQNTEHYLGAIGSQLRIGYPEHFNHSWSVALEEQFYLLLPLLLWTAERLGFDYRKAKPSRLILASLLAIAAMTSLRMTGLNNGVLVGRGDAFALGTLLAVYRASRTHPTDGIRFFKSLFILGFFLVLCVAVAYDVTGIPAFDGSRECLVIMGLGIPAFAIFGVALIALCADQSGSVRFAVLRYRPFEHLGKISYSTYLWHIPLLKILGGIFSSRGALAMPDFLRFPIMFTIVIALSHLSYRLIELPIMTMRRPLGQ